MNAKETFWERFSEETRLEKLFWSEAAIKLQNCCFAFPISGCIIFLQSAQGGKWDIELYNILVPKVHLDGGFKLPCRNCRSSSYGIQKGYV